MQPAPVARALTPAIGLRHEFGAKIGVSFAGILSRMAAESRSKPRPTGRSSPCDSVAEFGCCLRPCCWAWPAAARSGPLPGRRRHGRQLERADRHAKRATAIAAYRYGVKVANGQVSYHGRRGGRYDRHGGRRTARSRSASGSASRAPTAPAACPAAPAPAPGAASAANSTCAGRWEAERSVRDHCAPRLTHVPLASRNDAWNSAVSAAPAA